MQAPEKDLKVYLVGGAVRDALLDLPVNEHDWVVVGATPTHMSALGFRPIDADFPVFRHPETGDEYALARREIKTDTGYRGFAIDANPNITLEQDLIRRDLTINAIAQDAQGKLTDPFNGQDDLRDGYLRHISPAFSEDPVRLLRIARFAAKLGHCGFRVAHGTHRLMKQMVADGAVAELKSERIWRELKKSLDYQQPWRFFDVLNACGALAELFPTLARIMSPDTHQAQQNNHAMNALRQACKLSEQATVRLAALFTTTTPPDWLPPVIEKPFARLLTGAQSAHITLSGLNANDPEAIYHFLQQHRAWSQNEWFMQMMQVIQAQVTHNDLLQHIIQAYKSAAEINIDQLKADGFNGPELGLAIKKSRLDKIRRN